MSGFDKFAWIKAVSGDARFPERFLMTNIVLMYVTHGQDVFHVRQSKIAERFAVCESTVKRAIAGARRLGYLHSDNPRRRGKGRTSPADYRLALPDDQGSQKTPGQAQPKVTGDPTKGHRRPRPGVMVDVSTSTDATPKGSLKGSIEGSAPARQCSRHINNPNPPACSACRRAREDAEAWDKQQAERQQRETAAIRAAIDDCRDCDFVGRLDDQTDCPKHPNFRKASAA